MQKKQPLKIGLTGGIGSGKTTIANILKQLGHPIYIADTEAARLINNNEQIRTRLKENFGNDIYNTDQTLNKTKLADIIFNDKQALAKVNGIVHPEIENDFIQWAAQQTPNIVFLETAILFETAMNRLVDHTICVYASLQTRIERVMKRDHTTAEKVLERIKNQMDDLEKCKKSDFIIQTDEGNEILQQIISIINKINEQEKA